MAVARAGLLVAALVVLAACAPPSRGLGGSHSIGSVALREATTAVAILPNSDLFVVVRGGTPETEARAERVRQDLGAWLLSRGRFARLARDPEEADYVLEVDISGPGPAKGLTLVTGGRDALAGELALTERRAGQSRVIRRWSASGESPTDATRAFVARAASVI